MRIADLNLHLRGPVFHTGGDDIDEYLARLGSLRGSFGWNVVTGELFWSEEAFRIAGSDPAVNLALNLLFDRVHPEDSGRVKNILEHASQSSETLDFEHRFLMPMDL